MDMVNKLAGSQIGVKVQSTLMAQAISEFNVQMADTVMILHARQHWITLSATTNSMTSHEMTSLCLY